MLGIGVLIALSLMTQGCEDGGLQEFGRRLQRSGGGRRPGSGCHWRNPPCGSCADIDSCICKDGIEYTNADAVKHFCSKLINPIQKCFCDGEMTEWEPQKPERMQRPCGGWLKVEECTCQDGNTYNKKETRKNCKRRSRRDTNPNPIQSCKCSHQVELWTP
jgi:hypothetical protein